MKWFGPEPFSVQCSSANRVPIPVGDDCIWCAEPILGDDSGFMIPTPAHPACLLRMLVGGVNHQQKRCSCFGGTMPQDPPGLTRREAAEVAGSLFEQSYPKDTDP